MRLFGRHRSSVRPPVVARVDTLSAAEAQWRDRNIEVSRRLVRRYLLGTAAGLPSVEQLQGVLDAWRAEEEPELRPDALVNAVGMAFGANLAAVAQLTWVLTTDDDGVELALQADVEDVLVHPARAVARVVADGGGDSEDSDDEDDAELRRLYDVLLTGISRRSVVVVDDAEESRPPSRSA